VKPLRLLVCTIVLLTAALAWAGEGPIKAELPEACSPGWLRAGETKIYTPQNLYEYIDGEAELYMPYGFARLVTGFYGRKGPEGGPGLVVNLFTMGSPLDAFGIYANYRGQSADPVNIGAEGFVEESQLMYYQDRYFIQIAVSGSPVPNRFTFLSCAASIAKTLPSGQGTPQEPGFLGIPGLVRGSERYYPEGLLGHGSLGKGFTAEIRADGLILKAIIVVAESDGTLERALTAYNDYLTKSGATPRLARNKVGLLLRAVDPLYKDVILQQVGRYAVGVAGHRNSNQARSIMDHLAKGVSKRP
jgi:hypothetical protein